MEGIRILFSMIGFAALAACVAHDPLSDQYAGPRELPIAVADRFEYQSTPLEELEEPTRRWLKFTIRQVTLPSTDVAGEPQLELATASVEGVAESKLRKMDRGSDDDAIVFDYYDLDGAERTPVVVLLPVFNGTTFIPRYFARYFAHRGWASLVVHRDRDAMQSLDDADDIIRDNVLAYRRILDWIAQNDELDSGSIGLFGISLGAIDAVMLAAVDDRVDALVAALAGGDLASMLMTTRYRRVTRVIDDELEESGLSRGNLQRELDVRLAIDPLSLAPYVDAERVLMVLARADVIVPFEAQEELRESMGRPEALYLPTGHRTSVVYFPRIRASAYEFFARQFDDVPVSSHN